MIEYGRFTVRDLTDGGPGFIERARLSGAIAQAVAESRRLLRVVQSMTDSGRDATAQRDALGTLNVQTLTLSIELLEASVVAVDGADVDMDNTDDVTRVRKALDRLSRDEWQALLAAIQGEAPKSNGAGGGTVGE